VILFRLVGAIEGGDPSLFGIFPAPVRFSGRSVLFLGFNIEVNDECDGGDIVEKVARDEEKEGVFRGSGLGAFFLFVIFLSAF
jgi:hypothetical protein